MIKNRFLLTLIPSLALGLLMQPANLQADFIRGTGGGPPAGFTCGTSTVDGVGGITYGTVVGEDGNCWLDRNLGSPQVATASNDSDAYGYYYQWGRLSDGHQIDTSGTTTTLSTTDIPGHGDFITPPANPYDWRDPGNNELWQGVSGINNPCPSGFRLPTKTEWDAYITAANIIDQETAYTSNLKITATGRRQYDGVFDRRGSRGYYWSSDILGGENSWYLNVAAVVETSYWYRGYGNTVRCIRD